MPDLNDYHAYKSTSGKGSGGGSSGSGLGWIVVVIVVLMLLFFLGEGASFEAIETLLAFGFLGFLFVSFWTR